MPLLVDMVDCFFGVSYCQQIVHRINMEFMYARVRGGLVAGVREGAGCVWWVAGKRWVWWQGQVVVDCADMEGGRRLWQGSTHAKSKVPERFVVDAPDACEASCVSVRRATVWHGLRRARRNVTPPQLRARAPTQPSTQRTATNVVDKRPIVTAHDGVGVGSSEAPDESPQTNKQMCLNPRAFHYHRCTSWSL